EVSSVGPPSILPRPGPSVPLRQNQVAAAALATVPPRPVIHPSVPVRLPPPPDLAALRRVADDRGPGNQGVIVRIDPPEAAANLPARSVEPAKGLPSLNDDTNRRLRSVESPPPSERHLEASNKNEAAVATTGPKPAEVAGKASALDHSALAKPTAKPESAEDDHRTVSASTAEQAARPARPPALAAPRGIALTAAQQPAAAPAGLRGT